MGSALTTILALVLILIGLLGVYSGYKFFKIYLSIVAFIFGFVFAVTLFEEISVVAIIIASVAGLIMSSLSFAFYKLAVFIAFASFGASFGSLLLSSFIQFENPLWLTIFGAIIGLFIALFMQLIRIDKAAVIIITTLLGAYYTLTGVSSLIEGGVLQFSVATDLIPTNLSRLEYVSGKATEIIMSNQLYLIIFVFLISTGLVVQFRNYKKQ